MLLLVAWEELAHDEVAAAPVIPVGTVRSRLDRARRKVRVVLGTPSPTREGLLVDMPPGGRGRRCRALHRGRRRDRARRLRTEPAVRMSVVDEPGQRP
ncbi:hypothetical protein [Umezawaea tangerina]|uniref:hypothetical protein n=1 Tax=Umezawaea tangerina TaxID=84725 RepID=UPI003CCBD2CD